MALYDNTPDPFSADAVDVLSASKIVSFEFNPSETDPSRAMVARRSSLTLLAGRVTGSANTQLSTAGTGKFARCISLTLTNIGTVRVALCDSPTAVFTDGYPIELGGTIGGDLTPSTVYLVPESGSFTVALYGGRT